MLKLNYQVLFLAYLNEIQDHQLTKEEGSFFFITIERSKQIVMKNKYICHGTDLYLKEQTV